MASGNEEAVKNVAKTKEQIDKLKTKNDAIQYAHDITQKYNALIDDQNKLEAINTRLGKLEQLIKAENKELCREVARLNNRVVSLEREVLNRDQYARRRQLELWNLPETVTNEKNNEQLKTKVAAILSITGTEVKADDIDVVHPMKKEGRVIMELNRRTLRHNILTSRKNLKDKKTELAGKSCPKLSVVESMAFEYKRLDYVCRQLYKQKMLEKCFFFNGKLHVEVNGSHKLITHILDIIQLVGIDAVEAVEKK